MSLDTGKAQPPSGTSRAGKRAMAVTAAVAAAIVLTAGDLTACGITLSDAQIARIRG